MSYQSAYSGPQIDAAVSKSHLSGSVDPTTSTVGVLGQRYFNTTTAEVFECTATIMVDEVTTYTWRKMIANTFTETVAGRALDATKGKALSDLISTLTANDVGAPTLLANRTAIPSSDDLNTYQTAGNFYCLSASIAATLSNTPWTSSAFDMEVSIPYSGVVIQKITTRITQVTYVRSYATKTAATWEPWINILTSAGGNIEGGIDIVTDNNPFVRTVNTSSQRRGGVYTSDAGDTILINQVRTGGTGTYAGELRIRNPDTNTLVNAVQLAYQSVLYNMYGSYNAGPFFKGAGSPEGSVTAPVGSIYQRTDGSTSTTLYVKQSGTGNTGWVAK